MISNSVDLDLGLQCCSVIFIPELRVNMMRFVPSVFAPQYIYTCYDTNSKTIPEQSLLAQNPL